MVMTKVGQRRRETEPDADGPLDCRFCAIVRGEAQADILFADNDVVAFLDRRPLFPGHVLLIPRQHYQTLADLPNALITPLFVSSQLLARAVEAALEAEGTFVAMNNRVSQSVPHLHIHIVPRRRHDGLKGFFWPRNNYSDETEMARIGSLIRSAIVRLNEEASEEAT